MFVKSISPSWTYAIILGRKGGIGHEIVTFTLPSNQTQYQNNNRDAAAYFCRNLNYKESIVEVCIAVEDYDIDPIRVGISRILAEQLAKERRDKFDAEVRKYSEVDFSKTKDKSVFKELNIDLEKEENDDHFDELFDDIFNSPEFQKKYEALIQTFILDVVKSMLHKEIDKILSVEYIKKSDL